MTNKKNIKQVKPSQPQPKGYGWAKFAYVLAILSLIGTIAGAFFTFSYLTVIVYYFIIILIASFTLFLILLNDTFRSYMDAGEVLADISTLLGNIGVYICSGVVVTSLLSFVILVRSKGYQHRTAGIVLSIVSFVICIISIILHFAVPVMA